MKRLLTGLAYVALGFATTSAFAKEGDSSNSDRGKQNADHASNDQNHQHGQTQTIRGTVAGVTTIGEAVVDPKDGIAVEVETDYLTVLGSPRGAGDRQQAGNQGGSSQNGGNRSQGDDQRGGQMNRGGRQNVYLVAISPQTKVRMRQGDNSGNNDDKSDGQNQAASRQAFDKLEIGDRVEVEFIKTDRVNASSHGKNSQGDNNNRNGQASGGSSDQHKSGSSDQHKHGRNRIMMGDAKSITILSTPGSQEGSDHNNDSGQNSNSGQNSSRSGGDNK